MRIVAAAIVVLFCIAPQAQAQLLPRALPSIPDAAGAVSRTIGRAVDSTPLPVPLQRLRRTVIDELLSREPVRLDVDARGEPVLRGEYLAIAPDATTLAALAQAGFAVARRADEGAALGLEVLVLHDTRGRPAARAMRELRASAPRAEFAYQHLYLPAGTAAMPAAPPRTASAARVGLIDGGVADTPALTGITLHRFGCEGRVVPDVHATAVAARLAGGTRDTLYAADLWCGDRVGRATLGLVQALGWMARERVPVINVSLVGPDNPLLARAVQALVARGHVIVAAVGNDGPAAPPLYPAAYPGVIGVGGVDARLRVLPESASGPQVDFSAAGIVDARTRGTSFASPVVARVAAAIATVPAPDATDRVQRGLAQRARDLGAPGRDPRYGDGYVTAF